MKKSNSKSKALSAFKKLGAVTLITATLALFFTACNQAGNTGGGGGKPKHAITFSVDSTTPNGTLKAKTDGVAETETSPINVEEGKEITFTATANSGYRVKGWTLDGNAITEAGTNTEYKLKVSKPATVKVSFEPIPKYTVTLYKTANGKVTASPEIPEDKKMLKDTEITFTAKADDGYKVGKWTVMPAEALQANTGTDGSETAKVKITADTQVSVSFELIPVEGGAVFILSSDKLNIKVYAKTADDSPITVEGCNETTLRSDAWTELHAKGTKVILKGKITELYSNDTHDNKQPLTELNVQGLTSLQKLNCWNNQLTALNVQGCASLQTLECSDNKILELNVQGLTALQKLDCNDNKLPELNVQGLTALKELDCSRNQLTELNVQGLTSLQELNCYYNQLTALNVQGLTALKELDCVGNKLTALDVQDCASLKYLSCTVNQLNAQAMTALLNALPARETSDKAEANLYTKEASTEGNCKDYTQPDELEAAFYDAKSRNWKLRKHITQGLYKDI